MITILIADDEKKIKEMLTQMLKHEGYLISENWDSQDMIKILKKDAIQDDSILKDKIIELEDSLFNQKQRGLYKSVLEVIEKPLIEHALERTEGNQLKAARILGINRNTMRAKIKKLGLHVEKYKQVK